MHALDPAPVIPSARTSQPCPPRVLISAPEGARSPLVEELRRAGMAVLMAPPHGLVGEVERGAVDAVLLHTEGHVALEQLAAVREVSAVPVLVALRSDRSSPQRFFDAGADDCVFLATGRQDLPGRLHAVVRRGKARGPADVLRAGRFVLDLARHVFTVDGVAVHLPPKEFGLLALLLRTDGRVVGREEALGLVWGSQHSGDPTTVDVHVKRLRAKIEVDPARPAHLLTVRGLGYRFQA